MDILVEVGKMEAGTVTSGEAQGKRAYVRNVQIICMPDSDPIQGEGTNTYKDASGYRFSGPAGTFYAEQIEDGTWMVNDEEMDEPFEEGLDQDDAVELAYNCAYAKALLS